MCIRDRLYGDVKLLKNQKALFLPLKLDDERIVEIPFWTGNIIEQEDIADNAEDVYKRQALPCARAAPWQPTI